MKNFLFTLIFTFLYCCVNAQYPPWIGLNSPNGEHVRALLSIGTNIFSGTDSGIFLSTDTADTWVSKNNGLTSTLVRALVVSNSTILAGTHWGGIFKSIDNGANWSQVFTGDISGLAVSGSNIFAASVNDGIYLSTDNGAHWTLMNPGPINQSHLTYYLASSGNYLCAENYLGQKYRLTNDINNWDEISGIADYDLLSLASIGSILFVGTQKGVLRSKVGFALWLADFEGFGSSKVYSLAINGINLYAGTELGLYKIPLSAMSLGIEDLKENDLVVEIFPNPFTSSVNLKIKNLHVISNHDLQFSLFDLSGCEVYKTKLCSQSTKLQKNNLPTGMYFYQVKSETKILQAGRLIIY